MNFELTVGWLYPELMSTYGDRGNITVLEKRCAWRNIRVEIKSIEATTTTTEIAKCDIVLGGGSQDRHQEIVMRDLLGKKAILQTFFGSGKPGLFVCGSPQLLGHYYETAERKRLPGLGIFDMVTKSGFGKERLIGNLVAKLDKDYKISDNYKSYRNTVVGFENHSGRTYLGSGVKTFAKILKGFGNNGEDGTEGAVYRNCIATYSHGPFLPKNPHIADWLIKKALEVKYGREVQLEVLDDSLEWQAHDYMLTKLGIKI